MDVMNSSDNTGIAKILFDTNLNNILIIKEIANRSLQTASLSLGISVPTVKYIKDLNLLDCKQIALDFSTNDLLLTPINFEISFRQNLTEKSDILSQTVYAVSTSLFKST